MATTPAASATATIIQAAEHFVIDEATSVAKQISTKNAAEIKGIVNGVAKEAVAASDDSVADIIQNVEDGAIAIGGQIVKAAEGVIDAVEKHPELIAEGALAIAIGVASVVQPELIAGSVALVGKMAADASKDTINQIVLESGNSVVKGVAKDVSEETAELAAQDAAEKAKSAALEVAKEGSKSGVEATVDVKSTGNVTTEVVPVEGAKDGEKKVLTTISGDAIAVVREVVPDSKDGAVQGPIISEEKVHTSATATSELKKDSEVVTKQGPAEVVTTNELTGEAKAVVQDGPITAIAQPSSGNEGKELKKEDISVAAVDIKALAKEVAREMTELEAAKTAQTGEKTVVSSSGDDLRKAAEKLEADIKETAERSHEESSKPEEAKNSEIVPESGASEKKKEESVVAAEKIPEIVEEKTGEKVESTENLPAVVEKKTEEKTEEKQEIAEEAPILTQLGIVHPEVEDDIPETQAESAPKEVEQDTKQETSSSKEVDSLEQVAVEEPKEKTGAIKETPVPTQLDITHPEVKETSETEPGSTSEPVQEETKPEVVESKESTPVKSESPVTAEGPKETKESSPAPQKDEETSIESSSQDTEKPTSEEITEPEIKEHEEAQASKAPEEQAVPEPKKEESQAPASAPASPKTLWSAKESTPAASIPQTDSKADANHATTHAALASAHVKIALLSDSNELLHQKLDTMQEALLAITKALAERPINPPQSDPTPAPAQPEAQSTEERREEEPVATADNQLVLANPPLPSTAVVNKRMSVFGTIGWLFGAGSGGKAKSESKGKGHKRAQSTPLLSGEASS